MGSWSKQTLPQINVECRFSNFVIIDENVYGKSILIYKVELELLGVHVRLADVGNYFQVVVGNLKFPPNLSTPEALFLLLKCIFHVGIAESYLEKVKYIHVLTV